MTLTRDLQALQDQEFDVVVIGGGITGACLAHDAALRGLLVALVDKRDFGGATSAASSKLLHGGIRYLQQLKIDKLRESAFERCYFQRVAPHLTRYVPFVIPTYRGVTKGRAALRAALGLYDLLCAGQNAVIRDPAKRVPSGRCQSKRETLELAPILANQAELTGSCVLYESHMHSSERVTLAFVKSAVQHGAVAANYVAVERLLVSNGAVGGVTVRDVETDVAFDIRSRIVANAAGPWIPDLNRAFAIPGLSRNVTRFSKGAHLVTRPLATDVALVLPTRKPQTSLIDRGGRHLFVIPWRQRSLIGTSNVPFDGSVDGVCATTEDVAGLLADVNDALIEASLTPRDVEHAFAGLYPLTEDEIRPDVYQGTGTYQVVDHGRLGHQDGVVSVLGAKYTTARRVAELAADLIVDKLGVPAGACQTSTAPVAGGNIDNLAAFMADVNARYGHAVESRILEYLIGHYGTEIDAVLATSDKGIQPVVRVSDQRESVEAEIAFAVRHEMALHLDDVVLRRTGLGTIGHPGSACLERCAAIMGNLLGWSAGRARDEIAHVDAALRCWSLMP